MSNKKLLITGVGPGTGLSIVHQFVKNGYEVAMLARNEERLRSIQSSTPGTKAFPVDVTDAVHFDETLDQIFTEWGSPDVVIHNAVGGAFGNFMQVDPAILERNFQINVMAFLQLARRVTPFMLEAGAGSIIATGNTSSLRGKSNFAGFAPTKAAQRILAESIARELGPKGIHIAYVLIDAVIDVAWTRAARPDAPDDFFIQPDDIAKEIWHVVNQPRSAWSFNVEIRPFNEVW